MFPLLYLKRITGKDLLYGTLLSVMSVWMGGRSRGKCIHVYIRVAESLHRSPETITILLIGYTPIQNVFGVKFFKYINV